jgi:hypothetical protein
MKRELLDKYINRLRKRGDVIDVPMYCPVTGACSPYLFLYSSLSLTASFPLAYLLFFYLFLLLLSVCGFCGT